MAYFAVQYRYRTDVDVNAVRPAHRAYLASLIEAGQVKASGPYIGPSDNSALLIFQADSAEAVQAMINADPMSEQGVLETSSITEWNPLLGVFAD